MPTRSLHGLHDGRSARLSVGIVDAAALMEYRSGNKPLLRGVRPFQALIDTGATNTMISSNVVQALDLPPVGKKQFHSLVGPVWRQSYLFNVCFYHDEATRDDDAGRPDPVVRRTFVGAKVINGAEIVGYPSFDVLLGMDVITTGDLSIRRDGTFTFAF